ncbi:unnamed protein product [Urochloa decumbens]
MAAPNPRSRPDSQGCVLPLPTDALYEILLRVPAKDHCRLRAVSRPWSSLFSDPHFITAHGTRHQEALIVAGYNTFHRNDGIICDVMDLSGRVVKRVRATADETGGDEWVRSIGLDFICTSKGTERSFRLLNLATGAIRALPEGLAEEHAMHEPDSCHFHSFAALGQVPSTGQYKVRRALHRASDCRAVPVQLFEVLTLDGHARWRGKLPPPNPVSFGLWEYVAINGIVYFFSAEWLWGTVPGPLFRLVDRITSFDLEAEEWGKTFRGPISSLVDIPHSFYLYYDIDFSLSAINGCLVVVHRSSESRMGLWFLMDFEKCLWVKQHRIQVQPSIRGDYDYLTIHPLLVLNDGRVVLLHIANGFGWGWLRIYNPETKMSTDVREVENCFAVGLYTGSVLSLANCAS